MHTDHARGALLGLAVGDALGTTLEFTRPDAPPLPTLLRGPHTEIVGGGPFGLRPGQVTDDTQQAVLLATSLRERGGIDSADLARRYVAWGEVAFDQGSQTRAVLARLAGGEAPSTAGRSVWVASGRRAAGNGSLMRTAPIGVRLAHDEAARIAASLDDSAITHFDPRCQLACAAFNAAIAAACARGAAPEAMAVAARADLMAGADLLAARLPLERDVVHVAMADLATDLDAAASDAPAMYRPEAHLLQHMGFVRVAFRLAFWHLLHTPSFEVALIDVVNRGGDADTNGAIAGALLGAAHGEAAIPSRWRDAVLDALPPSPRDPFSTTYHPRLLLADWETSGSIR